jgi:hypothetical protein
MMSDGRDTGSIFGPDEPPRDMALAALLGEVVGIPPVADVNWIALAARIASAREYQRARWWTYAARWEQRAVPVALAAGLAGLFALWGLGVPSAARTTASAATDPSAAIVDGTAIDDAARSFARSVTVAGDPATVELY